MGTKKPIQYNISLSEEQKKAKALVYASDITLIKGGAGSGKTLVAVQCALDLFFKKEVEKLYFARPAVTAGEDLGFLPGTLNEKLEEFILPVTENIKTVYSGTMAKDNKVQKHLDSKDWEILSIGHLRGRTLTNCVVLIDECQNISSDQMALILTRLGRGSKMIFTGDLKQKDLPGNSKSGMSKLVSIIPRLPGMMAEISLRENYRSEVVKQIIELWDEL